MIGVAVAWALKNVPAGFMHLAIAAGLIFLVAAWAKDQGADQAKAEIRIQDIEGAQNVRKKIEVGLRRASADDRAIDVRLREVGGLRN